MIQPPLYASVEIDGAWIPCRLLGMVTPEDGTGDELSVVRIDGGLMLKLVHPSRVKIAARSLPDVFRLLTQPQPKIADVPPIPRAERQAIPTIDDGEIPRDSASSTRTPEADE